MGTSINNKNTAEKAEVFEKTKKTTTKVRQKSKNPPKKSIYSTAAEEGKQAQDEAMGNDVVDHRVDTPTETITISESTVTGSGQTSADNTQTEMVGLNLRIPKDKRALIKSWCALRNIPMNELFEKIIDQVVNNKYNPLV